MKKKRQHYKSMHSVTMVSVFVLFAIDIMTKVLFQGRSGLVIYSIKNPGASWGISMPLLMLILISLLVIVLLFMAYAHRYVPRWSFIFLLSGALGNLFDRLLYGGVRDWIRLGSFPIFNIADVCITVGVAIFIYYEWKKPVGKK